MPNNEHRRRGEYGQQFHEMSPSQALLSLGSDAEHSIPVIKDKPGRQQIFHEIGGQPGGVGTKHERIPQPFLPQVPADPRLLED
jgi:hypothetical protein